MLMAIAEAELAANEGNFPCGAVLVADNEMLDKAHNLKETKADRISHAEMLLYIANSSKLKVAKKLEQSLTMYTTLEPCLMCFGAAAIHRIDRIVVASPDPYGDMSKVKGEELGSFYNGTLPKLEYGLCIQESHKLMINFLKKKGGKGSFELISVLEAQS